MQTSKWAISGGGSFEASYLIGFGGAKVMWFHQLETDEKRPFFLVSGGVGARMAAKFKAGGLGDKYDNLGQAAKTAADSQGGNPLSASPPETVTVYDPFSFDDLQGAIATGISTGADAGVVGTALESMLFSRWGRRLFSITALKLEAVLGASINIVSYHGGVRFFPPPMSEAEQKKAVDNYNMGRKPMGASNQFL